MLEEYSHFIKLLERENNSQSMSSCVYHVIRETISYLKQNGKNIYKATRFKRSGIKT